MQLQVEPVQEAQRLELLLAELAVQASLDLAPELLDALVDQLLVEFVVLVHAPASALCLPAEVLADRGSCGSDSLSRLHGSDSRIPYHHLDQVGVHHLLAALR